MIQRNYRNRINLANDLNIDKRNDIYFWGDQHENENENKNEENNHKEINIQQI